MDGCNTSFLLGNPIFRGYVSFREGNLFVGLINGPTVGPWSANSNRSLEGEGQRRRRRSRRRRQISPVSEHMCFFFDPTGVSMEVIVTS